MIPRNKLHFDKKDLEFFDKQRDIKEIKFNDIHRTIFIFVNHGERISGSTLAKLAMVNSADIRKSISEIRRYVKLDYFITANEKGYTRSCFNKCCKNDLIAYFDKTQTRFKETFNELVNLMKCLNNLNEREKDE